MATIPAIPFSVMGIIPIVINILFNSLTAWLSAMFVTESARLQDALIFSAVGYVATILLAFLPIPSIPIVNISILAQLLIKAVLAMKLFNTDFKRGVSISGVQIIFNSLISLPF
jgi:hypothetical protein